MSIEKNDKKANGNKETGMTVRPEKMTTAELTKFGEFDEDKALATGNFDDAFMSLDEFREQARKSGLTLRKIMRLKAGQSVQGLYIGPGPLIELAPDKKTGVIKMLRTHGVQLSERIIADLMGSFQLDREFDGTDLGSRVMIAHLGQVETKSGQRVNDFHFLRPGKSVEVIIEEARAKQAKTFEATATVIETNPEDVRAAAQDRARTA